MSGWIAQLTMLAQDPKPAEPSFWLLSPPMIAMLVLAFFFLVLPQRSEKKKRQTFLESLKQNDRVVTIGGIIGTVANISPDRKEFTLKVDDGTRIKFIQSAIANKLDDTTPEGTKAS
ncbi:MAG TPA: preprotein translocase subunit YajC [Planctomycetaceae bacterium]|jgi:preprotein translocase subunit YajC|nr:preprotein translocase subunit YajC [Planctomycetaceae bacterium]